MKKALKMRHEKLFHPTTFAPHALLSNNAPKIDFPRDCQFLQTHFYRTMKVKIKVASYIFMCCLSQLLKISKTIEHNKVKTPDFGGIIVGK
jgi:hypothetical protein